jgi:putative transposase
MWAANSSGVNAPKQVCREVFPSGAVEQTGSLLKQSGESRERRDQLVHPPCQKPELLATTPNQLWSWDITKLLGPAKWTYFYLYVILDVFSRYVTGWMVAYRESAELAKRLIEESCKKPAAKSESIL